MERFEWTDSYPWQCPSVLASNPLKGEITMEKSINGKTLTMGAVALTCVLTLFVPTQAVAGPCDAEDAAQAKACQNEGSPECNAAAEARTNCLRANASSSDTDD